MGFEFERTEPEGSRPIILDTDTRAARYRTDVCGWVSRKGNFFGKNEEMARWDGATHVLCHECGKSTKKLYTHCDSCRKARELVRWNARERKQWDGQAILYSESLEEYFDDISQAEDVLDEGETLFDLRLVICEPVYLRQIDEEYWIDNLPYDSELPEDVKKALEALNLAIVAAGIVSWLPGKYAVNLDDF